MQFKPGPWTAPGPAVRWCVADPGWARSIAFALVAVIVGIGSLRLSMSTGVISLVASFITPAFGPGAVAGAGSKAGLWPTVHLPVLSRSASPGIPGR